MTGSDARDGIEDHRRGRRTDGRIRAHQRQLPTRLWLQLLRVPRASSVTGSDASDGRSAACLARTARSRNCRSASTNPDGANETVPVPMRQARAMSRSAPTDPELGGRARGTTESWSHPRVRTGRCWPCLRIGVVGASSAPGRVALRDRDHPAAGRSRRTERCLKPTSADAADRGPFQIDRLARRNVTVADAVLVSAGSVGVTCTTLVPSACRSRGRSRRARSPGSSTVEERDEHARRLQRDVESETAGRRRRGRLQQQ